MNYSRDKLWSLPVVNRDKVVAGIEREHFAERDFALGGLDHGLANVLAYESRLKTIYLLAVGRLEASHS